MKVLVDTPIWSFAFRRSQSGHKTLVEQLICLIDEQRALIIGPIRQEILSGYSNLQQFELLNEKLSYLQNQPVIDNDYIEAARFSNICRTKGIQGSHTDYLICAVAHRLHAAIFTTDNDFTHYQAHLPVSLYIYQH
ncbi:PIN domain-containing protein [Ectothiorhodospiraceae bacterium BW-2]|nr:PIN domain-containing protein [Ectothiorhodospiraceae bacterium BW-2]